MDSYNKYLKYKLKYNLLRNSLHENIKGGGTDSMDRGYVMVATTTLNQWALDFEGNEKRIIKAILEAKKQNAKIILLPELSTSGYSCQDHYLERETYDLSFQIILNLLKDFTLTNDILIAIGCPIIHNDNRYNTTIFIANREIILIRPKINLADDGNYREVRWFTAWPINKYETYSYTIDDKIQTTPIGVAILDCNNVLIAAEICEELWVPDSINSKLYLNGVDIILNGSGSHYEYGKLQKRLDLIKNATKKSGGAYIYSNLEGCDGERLYFDGGSIIAMNGNIINIEDQFDMVDIKVMTEPIQLSSIISYRMKNNSYGTQSSIVSQFKVIKVNLNVTIKRLQFNMKGGMTIFKTINSTINSSIDIKNIVDAASCWMWDYLRKAGVMGFMLPLSGGADSATTASIVFNMCLIMSSTYKKEQKLDFYGTNSITIYINKYFPNKTDITPELLCSRILNTVYLPTKFSSVSKDNNITKDISEVIIEIGPNMDENIIIEYASNMTTGYLAKMFAQSIGATHREVNIQQMFEDGINGIKDITGVDFEMMKTDVKKFRDEGKREANGYAINSQWDLLFQNIQARLRMVNTYLIAQAIPKIDKSNGALLVLGSSNADEILAGYYTKYDASAADINPIGSLSKEYINQILDYFSKTLLPLKFIRAATPTAELVSSIQAQTDETDMGITYKQIYELGKLRASGYGPIDSYHKIIEDKKLYKIFTVNPRDESKPLEPKDVINIFYTRYNINRNKATIIPPSVHLLPSPDDNRFDLRPFLYPPFKNSRQYNEINNV